MRCGAANGPLARSFNWSIRARLKEPLDLQLARAAEPGRGRKAGTPVHIPWQGWKDILLRTYNEILNDRLMAVAGGVVFYSLLSLFPAIAAGVSSYALFFDPESIAKQVAFAAGVVPSNALDMFRDEIIVSVANPKIAE